MGSETVGGGGGAMISSSAAFFAAACAFFFAYEIDVSLACLRAGSSVKQTLSLSFFSFSFSFLESTLISGISASSSSSLSLSPEVITGGASSLSLVLFVLGFVFDFLSFSSFFDFAFGFIRDC